jgi:hypothetical protein
LNSAAAKVTKAVEKAAEKVAKAAAAEERRMERGYGRNTRGGRGVLNRVQRGGRGRGRGRGHGGVRSLSTSPRKIETDKEASSDESNLDKSDSESSSAGVHSDSVHSDVSTNVPIAHTNIPEAPEAPGGRTRARRNIGMPQRYRT